MATVLKNIGCPPELINSVEDHVHILMELSRTVSEHSRRRGEEGIIEMDQIRISFNRFAWQAGYGIFALSALNVSSVGQYIADQQEHHRRRTFQEEYRAFLLKHNVPYDERYVWD